MSDIKIGPFEWETDPYNPRRHTAFVWPFHFTITETEFPDDPDEPAHYCEWAFDPGDYGEDMDQWGDYSGETLEESKEGVYRFVREVLLKHLIRGER